MKNETENNTPDIPMKEQVTETVIDIFVRTIGFIERKDVFPTTNGATDFYIDTDDLSLFLMAVEKHFGIKPTQEEWFGIGGTMEEIAGLVIHHLSKNR